ncbi:MAG: RND family efflux transporter MFP [Beijerinckiaceae bacterium]|nr:MAG: RND family efflux transporter MFP [Beijerinckiaceae bacterium]
MFSGRVLAVVFAIIVAAAGYVFWNRGTPVSSATVTKGDVAEVVYATGAIEPVTWSKVLPLLRARIVDHCGCEGKVVRKGDVLAKLDDTAAQAELRQIVAKRDFAQNDVARFSDLMTRGATTRLTLERAETELRQLDSQIAALTARLTDYLLALQVVADVNEEDIAKVVTGQTALLRNDGFPQGGLSAKVAAITPKGDPATKTFRAYLALPDETPLRIGMSVEANIVIREKRGVVLAPAEALRLGSGAQANAGQATAFVIENGKLKAVPVTIGIKGGRLIEITSGLAEGAALAAPVKPDFRDGMAVRVAR